MSEIKVNSIKGVGASAAAITVNNTDGTCTANITNQPPGNRNLIINGDMRIATRGSTSNDVNGYYHIDRFRVNCGSTGAGITTSQETDAPAGFHKSLKYTVTNAASSVANSSTFDQRIEGFNISHLNWGTSDAKGVTLSFHVKCSVANLVLGGALSNADFNMTYPFTYTTNSTANTWTKYTIYIPGPTTGTWATNNGLGIRVIFNLGSASARLATANTWANSIARGPTGAGSLTTVVNSTFFLTGVQLEVGSVATDFEHRSFAVEKRLCMRYYQQEVNPQRGGGRAGGTANKGELHPFFFPVEMRSTPTVSLTNTGSSAGQYVYDDDSYANMSSLDSSSANPISCHINYTLSGDLTDGSHLMLGGASSTSHETTYKFNAEL